MELFRICTLGKSQNPNESLHNAIQYSESIENKFVCPGRNKNFWQH